MTQTLAGAMVGMTAARDRLPQADRRRLGVRARLTVRRPTAIR